ncbi:MAG: DUF4474 domain-containing protein [Clostridiaceae bacterium]
MDKDELYKAIDSAGYIYDQSKDIFFTSLNPWQRDFGYCRLYDEALILFGMVVDCEPIYFKYGGQKWLIEFWKGQYSLSAGAEIGVYTPQGPELIVNGISTGYIYHCASDKNLLNISFVLKKNGKEVITREEKHWWLTGFKLGEFAHPSELTLDIEISLKDQLMADAFVGALKEVGYLDNEIKVVENTVSFQFNKPRTQQPITRTPDLEAETLEKNRKMADEYRNITGPYNTLPEKVMVIEKEAPGLIEEVMKFGKAKELLEEFKSIKFYVKQDRDRWKTND